MNDKALIAYPKLAALFDSLTKITSETMIKEIQESVDKLQESIRNIMDHPLQIPRLDDRILNTSDTQITDLSDEEKKHD